MSEPKEGVGRYRAIVENAPEILALLDATGTILYANPHMEKVLGYRHEEVKGRKIFEFVHPEDTERAAQEYARTIREAGEQVPSVLRIRASEGEWIPFEVIANSRLQDPEIQAIVFTARDLRFREDIEDAIRGANADIGAEVERRTTELTRINAELRIENNARRQAETRLEHTISLLNATLESTADGILVVSSQGEVTRCNRKFLEMWRLDFPGSIVGEDQRILAEVLDQLENPGDFIERVRTLYADPAATSFDVLNFKDGRIFERYSQPQRLDEKITGRVWSFRDVTRARNLEAELRHSQKMEALGLLAGGMAHDFNNLLMLISGYANQILDCRPSRQVAEISDQILAATRRAASVTKQLLTFSRKQPEAPVVSDLNRIVLNLEKMLRRSLRERTELEVSLAAEPQPVYVDVSQIEGMILNLVVNAQDAMPEGGQLSISTAGKSQPIPGERDSTRIFSVLEVRDTGHGMTPEVRAHIFEPFFTTKEVGKGTGLGLSSVLGVAQRAGGYIEVDSQPKRGTTFRIYLPQVEQPPRDAAQALVSESAGGNETILFAEDESGIRAMTRAYLESLGYRVLEAADGSEAIARSLEYAGPIHLVLTDLLMPGFRGDEAVKMIRAQRPEVKAVFISGHVGRETIGHRDPILYKPFDLAELGRQIRSTLDSSSGRNGEKADPAA
ncbi:MAG: PAS domain S-box protein [Acidobacteria bacterium]|nr:PAS domain S-box protein [Acidobacteriota bacterium]